jgi:hypothetical protein
MAYSISVVEGDSETIALGRDRTCTTPIAVVIEAGKAPAAPAAPVALPEIAELELEPELPHAAADSTRAAAAAKAARL